MNSRTLRSMLDEMVKISDVVTELQPHQQRVVARMRAQPGLVVAHGLGSGKTLSSIAAQDALDMPSEVYVPAALQANYQKELDKHVEGEHPDVQVRSLQGSVTKKLRPKAPLMIVDEAHRLRDPESKTRALFDDVQAKKRMLLTGTPFYNDPSDIAPLINIAAGKTLLPEDRTAFSKKYITEKQVSPGILLRLLGVKPGLERSINPEAAPALGKTLRQWVDYHAGSEEGMPEVKYEDIKVPMTPGQVDVYDSLLKKAPFWVRAKVRAGLPPSKSEAGGLNAFLTGTRQAATSTAPYVKDQTKAEQPKIDMAFKNLQKALEENDRAKAVVYSNYLQSGIAPYKAQLEKAKIPFGEFTGTMTKGQRDEMVRQYNENKLRVLLLSSAGGEGLDLKGTRLVQLLEPHWNEPKLEQVQGRGIRFGSHAMLPEAERNVRVERYLATRPATGFLQRLRLSKPDMTSDEYLAQLGERKARLIGQFQELLKQQD